jgi:hypothetical protein
MKYKHLLVPIDLNAPDQCALDAAFDRALQHRAITTMMYVIEAIDEAEDAEEEVELNAFYAELEENVRVCLQQLSQRFEHAGLIARPEIVVGRTASAVFQYRVC